MPVSTGDNTNNYSLTLKDLESNLLVPGYTNAYYLYSPGINSGAVWFSIGSALDIPVLEAGFQDPNFLSPYDTNYDTLFDIYEYTYGTNGYSVGADSTAVSFFSLPLYGYLSTPTPASLYNSGLSKWRNNVIETLKRYFDAAFGKEEKEQWNHLLLRSTEDGRILRVASTGKGTTTPDTEMTKPFDPNYLDNEDAYGYSYIKDIWTGKNSYYRQNKLKLTLPTPPYRTYKGEVKDDNTFLFKATDDSGSTVTFAPPTKDPYPTTTQAILGGIDMSVSDTSGTGDGVQISKLFQEAVIVGFIPTTDELSEEYLINRQADFYQVNTKLRPEGQMRGPWYDLYSLALHSYALNTQNPGSTPTIYSYAYDDAMWTQVLISSEAGAYNPDTYLGITLGDHVTPALKTSFLGQDVRESSDPHLSGGLLPPTHLRVKQVRSWLFIHEGLINIITWKPPQGGRLPVSYKIYLDRKLTKLVGKEKVGKGEKSRSHRFSFRQGKRKAGKTYHYFIVSVDGAGNHSEPAEVIFSGK